MSWEDDEGLWWAVMHSCFISAQASSSSTILTADYFLFVCFMFTSVNFAVSLFKFQSKYKESNTWMKIKNMYD